MHTGWILGGVVTLALGGEPAVGTEEVRAWVEEVTIPTYPVGEPEKNPIFYSGRTYQGAKGPMYPYPLLDKLSETKVNRSYQAVFLENRWIKLSILPELGGRIFSAVDKTNGYDFFYRQHVIKPALIGMVGAWISGGVEWNVPHHHRASTFQPVDWRITEDPDGSRTVWVGETEWRHRMRWIVGVTLRADRSWVEATVKVFNRTPLAHSILYFSNVAVHANEDYQVIFPPGTEWGTQHAKREFVRWPVGDGLYAGVDYTGTDVSWWKHHPRPVSIFAWNHEDDWFGGYDHGRDAGVVHVADHHQVPGKKFFEFANGPEGRMWDKMLTDTDGPYLELMSGAWSDNQPDYSWCMPGETKVARQVWYPVRGLGGIVAATPDAAMHLAVDRERRTVRVAFHATAVRSAARAVLRLRGRPAQALVDESTAISPDRPFHRDVPLPKDIGLEALQGSLPQSLEAYLEVDGVRLVEYRPEAPRETPKPVAVRPPPPPPEITSIEEVFLAGLRLDQFYSPALEPAPYYEEAIRRDPGHAEANTALGLLFLKRMMPAEAEARFRTAAARVAQNHTRPKECEALYYLGVALVMQGKDSEATDALERACWSSAWRSTASLALAESAARRGNLRRAIEKADRSIEGNARNPRAFALKAAALRSLGRPAEALAASEHVLDRLDPLDFVSWREKVRALESLGRREKAREARTALARAMHGSTQSYLEMAFQYIAGGFREDAREVLEVLRADQTGRRYPMVDYTLATLAPVKGRVGLARQASEAPPDLCFPFRFEELGVLRTAMASYPDDPRAPYYLGNLLYDHQPESAVAAWEKAAALDPTLPTVHRNLGLAYGRRGDLARAVGSLERAVELDSTDPRVLAELDAAYEATGADPVKRLASLESRHSIVSLRDETLQREIALQLLLGKVDAANRSLDTHHFHLWEGGEENVSNPHELHVDARLLRGKTRLRTGSARDALSDFEDALEYPERFEIGRPWRGGRRDAEIHWHIATAREALGDAAGAEEALEKAAAAGGRDASQYFRGLALRKLGREDQAFREFERLVQSGERALEATPRVDFFAKFGTGRSDATRKARGYVLLGLGRLGQGDQNGARQAFEEAIRLDAGNLRARTALDELR